MTDPTTDHELIIIGGGPAGLTAGIYGARAGLKTLIIERQICGGQIATAPTIENYTGYDSIMGLDLSQKMREHAKQFVEFKEMTEVSDITYGDPISVKIGEETLTTKALLFATGAKHRTLNLKSEFEFLGKGVSYCATCDGHFFRKKKVVVIGGGNTALMDAIYLKNVGCQVSVIHRRDAFRAEDVYVEQARCIGIDFIMDSVPVEFKGDEFLENLRVKNVKTNEETDISCDGAFVLIGVVPRGRLAKDIGVETDDSGYIIADRQGRTNKRLVYAAGDVTGGVKQAIVACGEGTVAALTAYEDIRSPYWCEI